eukprot:31455-Pelagococcus_subviridis.AAC.7
MRGRVLFGISERLGTHNTPPFSATTRTNEMGAPRVFLVRPARARRRSRRRSRRRRRANELERVERSIVILFRQSAIERTPSPRVNETNRRSPLSSPAADRLRDGHEPGRVHEVPRPRGRAVNQGGRGIRRREGRLRRGRRRRRRRVRCQARSGYTGPHTTASAW